MSHRFEKRSVLPASVSEVFGWHLRPGAFARLTPPWQEVKVVRTEGEAPREGSRVELKVKLGPTWRRWLVEHRDFVEDERFTDVTLAGPFPAWTHTHRVMPADEAADSEGNAEACELCDTIDYRLPGGVIGNALGGGMARKQLERAFAYRHATTRDDVLTHRRAGGRRLTVAVSGGTGLIGSALCALLTGGGHRVIRLVRGDAERGDEVTWSVERDRFDAGKLEGVDAVIHLAGEPIVGRWTEAKRRRIRESRVAGTRLLARGLASLERKPAVLISASAVGFYGDRDEAELDERESAGEGFLPEVARDWERAADAARDAGIRVVHPRLAMVLSPAGGALQATLPVFRMGWGGVLGSGEQVWPWITLDDAIDALHFCVFNESVEGPVNFAGPESVTNRAFTKTLGRVLGRPTVLPVPKFGPRMVFGELADSLLFASIDARPAALEAAGYRFRHPTLEAGLRHVLGA